MKGIPHELALSYGRQLWRHKWLSIALAWSVCAIGWTIVAMIPPKYESSARVYINADQLLTPILHGVAVDDNPARHVEYLQKTLLSRPNLEKIIHLSNIDIISAEKQNSTTQEELIQKLAREIIIGTTSQTTGLLTFTYRHTDPVVAKNVVSAVLTVLSENSTTSNRNEMENAKHFLDQQIQKYADELRAAEKRRAEFHQKFVDLLPALNGAAPGLEGARSSVDKIQLNVADARSRRDSLQHELNAVPKLLSIDAAGPQVIIAGQPAGARARLDAARAKLEELQLRFTDQHPDVIALRQQISELEARVAKEASKPSQPVDSEGRKTDIANPVYEQIKIRLVEAETVLTASERALKQAQDALAALEEKAHEAPGLEAQAQDLDRDYTIKKKSYDELLQRREQTRIAEAADNTAEKIQFRIVDAPQIPVIPAAPKRPLLFLGVFVLAIGTAIAAPLGLLQFDHSFPTITSLRALGLPVLGSVSRFALPGARRRTRFQIATVCASASALVMILGVLLKMSISIYGLGISS